MRTYLFIFLLFITHMAQAQPNKQTKSDAATGMALYSQKITLRVPVYKIDTLKFTRTKSIFSWNLYNPDNYAAKRLNDKFMGTSTKLGGTSITGQTNLYDTSKDSIFSRMSLRHLSAVFYLKEKTPPIDWEIADSTKKVGNYDVTKATAHFRGRDYTAWFAPAIPVAYGPWKLHGLPGLILQAYDQSGHIYFSATKVAFSDRVNVNSISLSGKEKHINLMDYKKLTNNFKKRIKTNAIKMIRPYASAKELSNMKFHIPEIELMETFKDSTDQ